MSTGKQASTATGAKDETQLVTFKLKEEEFGFDIMSVQEIIRPPKLSKVPRTAAHVQGISNLRGVILPVLDMRNRFAMEPAEETDSTRVLVVDVNGVKIGLRVDQVKRVTNVSRNEIEPPPAAICGTSADCLEGVVKLDSGKRIIMALNASKVCDLKVGATAGAQNTATSHGEAAPAEAANKNDGSKDELQQMVSFCVAKEEFAFPMECVREVLRVQTPTHIPDVPDYILGMLTVRGQLLPIIDLRRQLQQQSFADESIARCRAVREKYEAWLEGAHSGAGPGQLITEDSGASDAFRAWMGEFNSSSHVLMEAVGRLRAAEDKLNRLCKQVREQPRDAMQMASEQQVRSITELLLGMLGDFEQQITANIQDDQRIVVVDAGGTLLGLVVDHVNEVLHVPTRSVEPPPAITSTAGRDLSGIAKLDDGKRLLLLLDPGQILKDKDLERNLSAGKQAGDNGVVNQAEKGQSSMNTTDETQLVTFTLGEEEYGVSISQIQEIDRLAKITKVPKAAAFVEGVTNLRGEVIPVVDTRKRFGLAVRPSDDHTRIIIVDQGGVKTGLMVDSVREVLSVPRKDVSEPPETIQSGVEQQFVSGIAKVNDGKRIIFLLDVEQVLPKDKRAQVQ
jgi:purine-binding chemotaxis protein CheW